MKIALIGAGGKMGVRLGRNLARSSHDISYVEVSEAGQARVRSELGAEVTPVEQALQGAEVVILAVPDTAIGAVSAKIVPSLAAGTMVVILDAAAPYAGHLPSRADISYFVTHPCHPPIFNDETTAEGRNDHFGGIAARQSIVSALMQGPDTDFAKGEEVARIIWAPILRSHRLTMEQIALLEPALSETLAATLLAVMKQGIDEVVARGVPAEAARDFLLGHLNILGAVTFGHVQGVFSDACNKAIENGLPRLMRDDWKGIFEPEELAESIRRIT
ncbi:phosphogluconate dehydrogenase C-terminal domain-containing protein [Paracoccus sp. CPCC 101403]|uniref:Phosphogluconate dehydrogenase C-terminal domain-containing protein n=2 Tax=Paracoccus broussonetiae TaxID=3075834 RepID=A0ABU3EE06_9RHOB|nr:phosphogluconate dehydrogenase C-terminal domain-containing protein [Paracoccus sp. CPCC 101403]MDT1062047.1 phosphogluconate dehydrogenase C-terminal domain-containing protein [Paracoccus sp. CPCC 101403]